VVDLLNAATPGEWRWSANGNIMAPGNRDVDEICAVYTERDDDLAPRNAEAIIAAVNFLRKQGASLLSSHQPEVVPASVAAPGGGGEAVAPRIPATGPFVDRIIRIFRDHPSDDGTACVLVDFANATIQAMKEK
jgi:hypothetical protein